MKTVVMFLACSVLLAGVIVQAEEPSEIIAKTAPNSGDEKIGTVATNDSNFWKKINEWETLMEGKNGIPKDEAKAGQILTEIIKGVYLVKFGPADGFNPQTPGEYIQAFYKTSSLKSAKDRLGGAGIFRTKRENNKLMASFLTEQPDQMKQDIVKNPQLVFISSEEITPDKFTSHVKSRQESLQNSPVVKSFSPVVAKTVPESGDNNISFFCRVQSETEVFYRINIDGKIVGSGKAIPNLKDKMTHILSATSGDHVLTVTATGYDTWQKTITFSEGSMNGQLILVELIKSTK